MKMPQAELFPTSDELYLTTDPLVLYREAQAAGANLDRLPRKKKPRDKALAKRRQGFINLAWRMDQCRHGGLPLTYAWEWPIYMDLTEALAERGLFPPRLTATSR